MKKLRTGFLLIAVLIFIISCSHGFKINEPVTTKKGLKVTLTAITEVTKIGKTDSNSHAIEAKSGNVFVVVEETVENPTSSDIEETASVGLVGPGNKLPDDDLTASMAYEKEHPETYTDKYSPKNGDLYAPGKIAKSASVYEMPESDWKEAGWKTRILGDGGFQKFGTLPEKQ